MATLRKKWQDCHSIDLGKMDLIELAQEIGLQPKRTSSTNGGEYASSCPDCGGRDRFRIWPSQQAKNCTGTYWCRQCGKKGDAIQFCRDFFGMEFQQAVEKVGAIVQRPSETPHIQRSFATPAITPPNEKWSQRALDFVLWASQKISCLPSALEVLEKRGIPKEAVDHYCIGYCDRDLFINPQEFGLESDKKIFIPEGIVIPAIEPSGKVIRLKIRRSKWNPEDQLPKYWMIRGSMNGLNIVGSVRKPAMLVVESELDAFAIDWLCNDLAFTVSVGSNTKSPDNVVDYWAKRRRLLICHDNDEGGLAMNEKWRKLYSHAESVSVPLDLGKDIGEAIGNGLQLRRWIEEILTGGSSVTT